jgi:hypothetical protein
LLGFILVGAAITVLIAWTLALADLPGPSKPLRPETLAPIWPDTPPAGWAPAESCVQTRQWWGDTVYADDGKLTLAMQVERVGLPLRALASTQVLDGRGPRGPGVFNEVLGLSPWQVGIRPSWRPLRRIGPTFYHTCILGIRPIWPGLALNTLFYAGLAWGLWQVPLDIRRRRRRRMNRCVKCGYDRAGIAADAKCPECGH